MRIIVDGNDGVGKTTLAKKLQKDLNIKSYIHLSYNDPRDYDFYYAMLNKKDVIFDRSFFDEPIYSEVLKRKSELTDKEFKSLNNFVFQSDIFVIFCTRSDGNKKYKKDEDSDIIDNESKIDQYFYKLAFANGYVLWSTDTANKKDYENLVEFLANREEQINTEG